MTVTQLSLPLAVFATDQPAGSPATRPERLSEKRSGAKTARIVTASWFTPLPDNHVRIGISRGTPRGMAAGYRMFRRLAPGPWFNSVEWQSRRRSAGAVRRQPVVHRA